VQKFIEDPLSEELLYGRFSDGDHIIADLDDHGQIIFRKGDGSAAAELIAPEAAKN
jgi:hypothetical protein